MGIGIRTERNIEETRDDRHFLMPSNLRQKTQHISMVDQASTSILSKSWPQGGFEPPLGRVGITID